MNLLKPEKMYSILKWCLSIIWRYFFFSWISFFVNIRNNTRCTFVDNVWIKKEKLTASVSLKKGNYSLNFSQRKKKKKIDLILKVDKYIVCQLVWQGFFFPSYGVLSIFIRNNVHYIFIDDVWIKEKKFIMPVSLKKSKYFSNSQRKQKERNWFNFKGIWIDVSQSYSEISLSIAMELHMNTLIRYIFAHYIFIDI